MDNNKLIIDEDLRDLIPDYIEKRIAELGLIEDKLNANDFVYLKQLAHDWQGTGGGYGIPLITEIGERLNTAAKAGDKPMIRRLAGQLGRYLERVEITYE